MDRSLGRTFLGLNRPSVADRLIFPRRSSGLHRSWTEVLEPVCSWSDVAIVGYFVRPAKLGAWRAGRLPLRGGWKQRVPASVASWADHAVVQASLASIRSISGTYAAFPEGRSASEAVFSPCRASRPSRIDSAQGSTVRVRMVATVRPPMIA